MRRTYTLALTAAFALVTGAASASAQSAACARSIGTIKVPQGFCIEQAADSLSGIRHFAISPAGDLYAATRAGLVLMHDTNHDGRYDTRKVLYSKSGNDVVLHGANTVYYTPNDAVVRIT